MMTTQQDLEKVKAAAPVAAPKKDDEAESRADAPLITIERDEPEAKAEEPEAKPKTPDAMSDDKVMAGFKACGKRLSILKARREEVEAEIRLTEQKSAHLGAEVVELEKRLAPEADIRRVGRELGRLYLAARSLPRHLGAIKAAQWQTHQLKDELKLEAERRDLFGDGAQGLEKAGRRGKPGGRKRSPKTADMAAREAEIKTELELGMIDKAEARRRIKAARSAMKKRSAKPEKPEKPKKGKDGKKGRKSREDR